MHGTDNISLCTRIPSRDKLIMNLPTGSGWDYKSPMSFGDTSMGVEYATGF